MTLPSDFYSGSWIPGPALPWNQIRTPAHVFLPEALEDPSPKALCGAGPATSEERHSLVFGRPDYAPWKAECDGCYRRLREMVRAAAFAPHS